jgi:hypothetical protein
VNLSIPNVTIAVKDDFGRLGSPGVLTIDSITHEFHCSVHDDRWCEHIQTALESGFDASLYRPNMKISIPVFPSAGVFVEVTLGDTFPEFGPSALMSFIWTPDLGRERIVNLGFWNPGDGAKAIRSVIVDWFRSELDPGEVLSKKGAILTKCPSSTHGFYAERKVDEHSSADLDWKLYCLWNIVLERACTICMAEGSIDPSLTPNF